MRGLSISLSPPQVAWPNKTDAEAAIQWSSLAKVRTETFHEHYFKGPVKRVLHTYVVFTPTHTHIMIIFPPPHIITTLLDSKYTLFQFFSWGSGTNPRV